MAKEPKLGSGKRFQKLERHLAAEGVHDPKAAAAAIGRKAHGEKAMARYSAEGRHRAAERRHGQHPTHSGQKKG
jgi:hypothetical protein